MKKVSSEVLAFFTTTIGSAVLQALYLALLVIPMAYLPIPTWLAFVILCLFVFTHLYLLTTIIQFTILIWSFIIFVRSPFDTLGVLYLCCIIVWLLFFAVRLVLPSVLSRQNEKDDEF